MKQRFVTLPALASMREIFDFIAADNPNKASGYITSAEDALAVFDEQFLPLRAHARLPEYVRQVQVPGYKGYMLWIAVTDEAIAIVAAMRPGLSTSKKLNRARSGLTDL